MDLGDKLMELERDAPFGKPADIDYWLNNEPGEREEIFEGILVKGVVGGIFAQGGVGKTFFLLCLILSVALGRLIFKSFKPIKAIRVLAFLGEDPEDEIHRRFKNILREFGDIDCGLLNSNLKIYCGKGVPFMKLDGDKNPVVTEAFDWLERTVKEFNTDIIFIDPKVMHCGLDENSNDYNAQWVNALRHLTENGCTVIYTHHVTKALSGTLELNSSRGGSALVDNSRFAANMRQLSDGDAKKYDIDEPWRYIEFKVTKNSYVQKLPGSIFFKFTDGGALEEVDLKANQENVFLEYLVTVIQSEAKHGNFYTVRDVERNGTILPELSQKNKKAAIKLAIDSGQLTVEKVNGTGRPRKVLRAKKNLLADMAQNESAELIA